MFFSMPLLQKMPHPGQTRSHLFYPLCPAITLKTCLNGRVLDDFAFWVRFYDHLLLSECLNWHLVLPLLSSQNSSSHRKPSKTWLVISPMY